MKTSKKMIKTILAIVLTISIVTTAFVVSANTKEVSVEFSVDKTELSAGESATVSVTVNANFPVATMSIPVFYDKTLVSVSDATATSTDYSVSNTTTDAQSVDTSKVYDNTGVSSTKFGFVLVSYIGAANQEVPETMNSVVLTFKITANQDVEGDAVIKCVSESAKTDDNVAGMLYFGSTTNGTTIDSIPENIENIDVSQAETSVSIITGKTQLMVVSETTGVIDEENGYVYGVPAGTEDLNEFFTVANGTFEMVANDGGYTNGTGATLVVKDTKGSEVATYTLIIFGDVNGDGSVTAADSVLTKMAGLGSTIEGEAYAFAADVNADGSVTAADSVSIKMAGLGGDITVNPYA